MAKLTKAMKAMAAKLPDTKDPQPLGKAVEILKGFPARKFDPECRDPHAPGDRPGSG